MQFVSSKVFVEKNFVKDIQGKKIHAMIKSEYLNLHKLSNNIMTIIVNRSVEQNWREKKGKGKKTRRVLIARSDNREESEWSA